MCEGQEEKGTYQNKSHFYHKHHKGTQPSRQVHAAASTSTRKFDSSKIQWKNVPRLQIYFNDASSLRHITSSNGNPPNQQQDICERQKCFFLQKNVRFEVIDEVVVVIWMD